MRVELSMTGTSITDLAKAIGVDRMVIYDLLRGQLKGVRGPGHRAAVLLGLKRGVVTPAPNTTKAAS